jgi:hypothetical protein
VPRRRLHPRQRMGLRPRPLETRRRLTWRFECPRGSPPHEPKARMGGGRGVLAGGTSGRGSVPGRPGWQRRPPAADRTGYHDRGTLLELAGSGVGPSSSTKRDVPRESESLGHLGAAAQVVALLEPVDTIWTWSASLWLHDRLGSGGPFGAGLDVVPAIAR